MESKPTIKWKEMLSQHATKEVIHAILQEKWCRIRLSPLGIKTQWPKKYLHELGGLTSWLNTVYVDGQKVFNTVFVGPGLHYVELNESVNVLSLASGSVAQTPNTVPGNESASNNDVSASQNTPVIDIPSESIEEAGTSGPGVTAELPSPKSGSEGSFIYPIDFFHLPPRAQGEVFPREASFDAFLRTIRAEIEYFRNQKLLVMSFAYNEPEFGKFEFSGDASLKKYITDKLFHFYGDIGTGFLNTVRQDCEQKLTMALLFDELKLAEFMTSCPKDWTASSWKPKCDVLEAIVGELEFRLAINGPYYPQRARGLKLVECIVQGLLHRGHLLKDDRERKKLMMEAPLGAWPVDIEAQERCTDQRDKHNRDLGVKEREKKADTRGQGSVMLLV